MAARIFSNGFVRFIGMVYIYGSQKNACYHYPMSTSSQQSVREEAKRIKTDVAETRFKFNLILLLEQKTIKISRLPS